MSRDIYGRLFEDHYKTILDNETPSDWESLVVRIKREFVKYPFEVGWTLSSENYKRPSTAMQGNLLEAINTTLNLLQFHYLDRDVNRTGNSIVVVSPECGVFEVDKTLAGITYQRMMDNGIGSDMLCLGLPPLHIAPYFLYNDVYESNDDGPVSEKVFSEVPDWMHLSFVSYDDEDEHDLPPIYEAEEQKSDVRIAPNGFLVPEVIVRAIHRDSSHYPTIRNYGSPSLSKSQTQQRQLISGRNFRDILAACRPRTSSYLVPSALKNLILLHSTVKDDANTKSEQNNSKFPIERLFLKEWGTVSFDEVVPNANFMGHSSTNRSSPVQGGTGIENGDRSDSSGKSSPNSSFTSQFSNTMGRSMDNIMGRSMDRSTPSPIGHSTISPTVVRGALHIQRSPSLHFDADLTADDSEHGEQTQEFDVEQFQKLMIEHDERFAQYSQSSSNVPVRDPMGLMSTAGEEEDGFDTLLSISADGDGTGGIGAALMRYNIDDDVPASRELRKLHASGRHKSESPTQLGPIMVSSRSGMARVNSDPPDNMHGGVSPQIMQAFLRSQHKGVLRLSSSQGPVGATAASVERRRKLATRPVAASALSNPPSASAYLPTRRQLASVRTLAPPGSAQKKRSRCKNRGSRHDTKRKSVVNPFRQQDEDGELEVKSHNRRRWSHVFPPGELEFKRHAGPQWESLCQPAALPLTIDFFPTAQELRDGEYTFTSYDLTLQGLENKHYATYSQLLMEMVRQRVTQDYQVVPPPVLLESGAVREGDIQHILSMGHTIHMLSYDSLSDKITVKLLTATTEEDKPVTYHYSMYLPSTKSYCPVVQMYEKYSKPYLWNRMDHAILDDVDYKGISEESRYRRIQFGIMPPSMTCDDTETEFVDNFQRLLANLSRLRDKDGADETSLDVKILTKDDSSGSRSTQTGKEKI